MSANVNDSSGFDGDIQKNVRMGLIYMHYRCIFVMIY